MRIAAVALLLTLAACSGGSGGSGSAPTTAMPTVAAAGSPTNPPPTGVPAPAALSGFRCQPDDSGTYGASGTLANASKATVTFQVTVNVGLPGAAAQAAKTVQVAGVKAGGSVPFEIDKIPVVAEGGTCHVQVVTTK